MIKIKLPNPAKYAKVSEWLKDLKDVVSLLEINFNSMVEKGWEEENLLVSYAHNFPKIKELQENEEEKYGDYEAWQTISIEIVPM